MKSVFLTLLLISFAHSSFADIEINQGYIRAVPPGQKVSAAYMNIVNKGGQNITITGAKSTLVKSIEFHRTSNNNGVMSMRKIDKLVLTADQKVTLKPGGLHLMLVGLKRHIKVGDKIQISFILNNMKAKVITLPVR